MFVWAGAGWLDRGRVGLDAKDGSKERGRCVGRAWTKVRSACELVVRIRHFNRQLHSRRLGGCRPIATPRCSLDVPERCLYACTPSR